MSGLPDSMPLNLSRRPAAGDGEGFTSASATSFMTSGMTSGRGLPAKCSEPDGDACCSAGQLLSVAVSVGSFSMLAAVRHALVRFSSVTIGRSCGLYFDAFDLHLLLFF
jgi:hypothetical protein